MENKTFQQKVAEFLKGEGIDGVNCRQGCETHFSKYPCDCCGSDLAGNRHEVDGWKAGIGVVVNSLSICDDCVTYLVNGQVPEEEVMEEASC